MENKGFIKLHRQMLGWGWYTDTATKCVFLHLLLLAAWEEGSYREVRLAPGQAVSSIRELSAQTGVSVQSVRTALRHLKSTGEITQEPRGKYSVFTIENYARYQGAGAGGDWQPARRRHGGGTGPDIKKQRSKDTLPGAEGEKSGAGAGQELAGAWESETGGIETGGAGAWGTERNSSGACGTEPCGSGACGTDPCGADPTDSRGLTQREGLPARPGPEPADPEGFGAFWAAYPKQRARADAARAWKALAPDHGLQARMLSALESQKAGAEWQREGGRFVPYPGAWLRGRRWEDEPAGQAPPEAPVQVVAREDWSLENALDGLAFEAREG